MHTIVRRSGYILIALLFSALCLGVLHASVGHADTLINGGGGMDGGGGGERTYSTDEEIVAAVEWARSNLLQSDRTGVEWSVLATLYRVNFKSEADYQILSCIDAPKLDCVASAEDRERIGLTKFSAAQRIKDYLPLSRYYLKMDGACPAPPDDPAGDHASASVTKFRVGADICFSVPELRSVPPYGLKAEVAALWVHEMAHLLGYKEPAAKRAQLAVLNNYDSLMRQNGGFESDRILTGIHSSLTTLLETCLWHSSDVGGRKMSPLVGFSVAYGTFNSVSNLPSGLTLRMDRAHPEMTKQAEDSLRITDIDFERALYELQKNPTDAHAQQLARKMIREILKTYEVVGMHLEGDTEQADVYRRALKDWKVQY